jgi:hypothetical protein
MSGQARPCQHSDMRINVAHYWPVDVGGEALVGDPRGDECEDVNPR